MTTERVLMVITWTLSILALAISLYVYEARGDSLMRTPSQVDSLKERR